MGEDLTYFDGNGREELLSLPTPRYCSVCGTELKYDEIESHTFSRQTGKPIKMRVWDCPRWGELFMQITTYVTSWDRPYSHDAFYRIIREEE